MTDTVRPKPPSRLVLQHPPKRSFKPGAATNRSVTFKRLFVGMPASFDALVAKEGASKFCKKIQLLFEEIAVQGLCQSIGNQEVFDHLGGYSIPIANDLK